ncbi:hypothetical protein GQ600_13225 [Phytophthora cactorum]|nr:hypothetical protein GQ600_13225 [Phytophthora cactorum]
MSAASMDSSALLVWLLYASVALVLLLLSTALVLYAQPKHGASSSLEAFAGTSTLSAAPLTVSSRFVNGVCILALYIALLCLFTAPVDVYLLENALPHVYFAALACIPSLEHPGLQLRQANGDCTLTLKFSAGATLRCYQAHRCFLLGLSFLLIMLMVVLLCGKPASSDIDCGILALTGMYLWLFVCSRGLASVPLVGLLMEDHSIDENMTTFEDLLQENAMETQATKQTKETILQRYAVEQQMSGADQERLSQLKTRESFWKSRFALTGKLSCWKIPIGVVLIILSLLIVVSMLVTSIDKMAHSNFERGFLLNAPEFPNPMDLLLVLASRVFPLDYVVFAVLFVYLFTISLIPRLTTAATMTMLSLVLMQLAMVGLFALLTLAPQYATFGHQMFADVSGRVMPCTLQEAANAAAAAAKSGGQPTHCRMTQLARFYNALAVELPIVRALDRTAYCMAKKLDDSMTPSASGCWMTTKPRAKI